MLGSERGKRIDNAVMFAKIAFCVMKQGTVKSFYPSFYPGGLMRSNAVPVTLRFSIKPHLMIGIPAAVLDPAAGIPGSPGDPKSVGKVCLLHRPKLFDRFPQLRCDALVGIYPEDPVA